MIEIKSSSKIIITGEHFFFYTGKAILLKIDNFIFFKGDFIKKTKNDEDFFASLHIKKFNLKKNLTFSFIKTRYCQIIDNYLNFLKNEEDFNKILPEKEDFFILIFGFFLINYSNFCNKSFKLKIYNKKNYLDCKGLGSSASFIIGNINFICSLFGINLSFEEIFEISLMFENFKHGKSSGIDILPIIYNKEDFLIIEKKANSAKQNYYCEKDFYFDFKNFIKRDFFTFSLNFFNISFIENNFLKDVYIYKSFDPQNSFNTQEIIKEVSKKKDFIVSNLGEIEQIFFDIKNALLCFLKKDFSQKNLFFEAIVKNNLLLNELDIIPLSDMDYIESLKKEGFFGKLTGSRGKKNIPKSAGTFIFFKF